MTVTQPALLAQMLRDARSAVFFGGAGVSTESGIPDFRSADGLYNRRYTLPAETILSHEYFMDETDAFYDFYRHQMLMPARAPTPPTSPRPNGSRRAKYAPSSRKTSTAAPVPAAAPCGAARRRAPQHCMSCGKFHSLTPSPKRRACPAAAAAIIARRGALRRRAGSEVIQGALDAITRCDL